MSSEDNLRVTVDDVGVFVHFKASDGQEAHFDMIEFGWQRGPVFGGAVLAWCRDRINEQPANTQSPEVRSELLAETHLESLPKTDLEEASERYGNPEPISHEWLDENEARAIGASAVSLPGDQFLALLAVARNGLS